MNKPSCITGIAHWHLEVRGALLKSTATLDEKFHSHFDGVCLGILLPLRDAEKTKVTIVFVAVQFLPEMQSQVHNIDQKLHLNDKIKGFKFDSESRSKD